MASPTTVSGRLRSRLASTAFHPDLRMAARVLPPAAVVDPAPSSTTPSGAATGSSAPARSRTT